MHVRHGEGRGAKQTGLAFVGQEVREKIQAECPAWIVVRLVEYCEGQQLIGKGAVTGAQLPIGSLALLRKGLELPNLPLSDGHCGGFAIDEVSF